MQESLNTFAKNSIYSHLDSGVQHNKLLTMMEWRDRAICISEVSKTIISVANLNVFVRRLYRTMMKALLCNNFSIYLIDVYDKQLIEIASMLDINAISAGELVRIPNNLGRLQIIMRDGNPETVDINNPCPDECVPRDLKQLGYEMLLTVPLIVELDTIGIYCAIFKESLSMTAADLEYALLLGNVVGSMIYDIKWENRVPLDSIKKRRVTPPDNSHANERMQFSREHFAAQSGQFSEREWEIMELIADGLSNQEIAASLYLSSGTVKKYISNLMQKVGATSRVQIAVLVLEKRFLAGEFFA